MAIIFINRFFYPDHSATSQILTDLARGLAQQGYEVKILTSRSKYDDPTARLPSREIVFDVEVIRIWTSSFGRSNLIGRAVDYLSFYLSLIGAFMRIVKRHDIVVAKTDPPMLSVVVAPLSALKRSIHINWMQDIFPEIISAGVPPRWGIKRLALGCMMQVRNWSCRMAEANVVIGERMAERVATWSRGSIKTITIPNWAIGSEVRPVARGANPLSKAWGIEGSPFIVGYSGNLGRAHEFETFLSAMSIIDQRCSGGGRHAPLWLFIGGGALYDGLQTKVAARGLACVNFKPYQPRSELSNSLSLPDVHLISLRPELEGLIVPSKFYGIAAAGRPSIFVGDPDGEISRVLIAHDIGLVIEQNDGEGLTDAIQYLRENPEHCRLMGENARHLFEQQFDLPHGISRWTTFLESCGAVPRVLKNQKGNLSYARK